MKQFTLSIIRSEDSILLGRKSVGRFGGGYWNGFGGKIEQGESPEQAAIREIKEESGLIVSDKDLNARGILRFHFIKESRDRICHIFEAPYFSGRFQPSDEMKEYKWWPKNSLPYDQMWQADYHWIYLFLHAKLFKGTFLYKDEETKQLILPIKIKPVVRADFNSEFDDINFEFPKLKEVKCV